MVQQRLANGSDSLFPGVVRDDVAVRINEHERRPRTDGIRVANYMPFIDDHGVLYPDSLECHTHRSRPTFVGKLRYVDAYHLQDICKFPLQALQVVEQMEAVDTAERPEIEYDKSPSQVQAQRKGA